MSPLIAKPEFFIFLFFFFLFPSFDGRRGEEGGVELGDRTPNLREGEKGQTNQREKKKQNKKKKTHFFFFFEIRPEPEHQIEVLKSSTDN